MRRAWLLLLLTAVLAGAQSPLPHSAAVAQAMRQANDYWIAHNAAGNAGWARSAYHTGNQRAFRVLGDRDYYRWAVTWAGANQWRIGPEGAGSANAYCCGQTYIDLYRLDPQPPDLADIQAKMAALVASPAVNAWTWIDAFYMAGPTLARLGNLTGDTNYFEKLWLMYDDMKTRQGLYDPSVSLWFRDATFIYPLAMTANSNKVFWSRGNGWVFAGLARVLQQMSPATPHYQAFLADFQAMAPAVAAVQGADGLWRSSLLAPADFPNPETSGTGFFTYGFAWGIRAGLLPAATYTNVVGLAWQGLTNLALNPGGLVGYVQGVGAQPGAASPTGTADFGVGAFLLACSEINLLAPDGPSLLPWAGPDQTLIATNGNHPQPLTLDATQTEVERGSIAACAWLDGTNVLATSPTAQVSLPPGPHVITLQVQGSDGLIYTDAMSVLVTTQAVAVIPTLKLQFNFEDSGTATTDSVAGVSLNLVNAGGALADLHGAPGSGVAGLGQALDFTSASSQGGNGPLASVTSISNLDLGTLDAFTVSLWIKPAANLFVNGFPRLFSVGAAGDTDRGVTNSLQLLGDGNLATATAVQGYVNTLQTSTTAFGLVNLLTNQWTFLALAYDGASLNLYAGSETNSATLMSSAPLAAGSVVLSNSWSLFLGNRLNRDRGFRGQLDDARLYSGAGDANFIEAIRQAAAPPARVAGALAADRLTLRVNTRPAGTYVLEATPDLTPPATWNSLSTNAGTGATLTNILIPDHTLPAQYYRYELR